MNGKQYTKVRAIFNPQVEYINTLRPEAIKLIGKEVILRYAWLMDENDSFPNVWALTFDNYDINNVGWIPEFDLDIIEILE